MNKVCLTGRISTELEIKKTPTGKSLLDFNLAVKRDYKNDEGKYDADFIHVKAWGGSADYLGRYAMKGSLIELTGKIVVNEYQNSEGKKVTSVYVQADGTEILAQPQEKKKDNFGSNASRSSESVDISPDELPFY